MESRNAKIASEWRFLGLFWRRGRESNPSRRLCRPLHNRFATSPEGIVRLLSWTVMFHINRRRIASLHSGAGEESRTLDLNLGKVALYQLSYSRTECFTITAPGNWSGRRVSNSRPQPWQGCALPTELLPHSGNIDYRRSSGNFQDNLALHIHADFCKLEREKSLELSTSTLARLRSTN